MTTSVPFINSLSSGNPSEQAYPERGYAHEHVPGEHGHTHEHLNHPGESLAVWRSMSQCLSLVGRFSERDLPEYTARNFEERGFTVGIGGYVAFVTMCPCNST